ncbi:MAG TPA: GntR family transcriptional regulator [Burkholderiales bacterium]|nr:GntR family transcriptional regulator [Burkholderiales bacterium]
MFLSISAEDFGRLESYLPRGLVAPDESDPLSRARGRIQRLILMQHLHPGHKIPMDEIAQHVGASRTPVREALRLLETEGLVQSLPNRGFIVRRIGPGEAEDLYDTRCCLERHAATRAWQRRSKAFLAELRALHRIYERVLGGPQDRRRLGMLVDKAFHLRIAEQAGNAHLREVLANTFDRLILTRPMDGFPVSRMKAAVDEHKAIVSGFEAARPKLAVEAVARNIEQGGGAIVAHLRSLEEFRAMA